MSQQVQEVFKTLDENKIEDYRKYWGGLTVSSDKEFFQRWLFAFCSVHTGWKSNVAGYEAIKDFYVWWNVKDELRRRLVLSRCGLYNTRTENIWNFSDQFWRDPKLFYKQDYEPWWSYRDRLSDTVKGLGLAKTSFALEMSFPTEAKAVCLDVHMLRLYGNEKAGASKVKYQQFEADWVGRSSALQIEPYVARMVYWDQNQGMNNSRYWSKCLET